MADNKPLNARHARLDYFRRNTDAKALITKLVTPKRSTRNFYGTEEDFLPSQDMIQKISNATSGSMSDAENILEVLPEAELAMSIRISSILSPNDLTRTELNWSVMQNDLDSSITGRLIEIVKRHFETGYNIKQMLPDALECAIFRTGSYPILIVPESSVDEIINGDSVSLESLKPVLDRNYITRHRGILGSGVTASDSVKGKRKNIRSSIESIGTLHNRTYQSQSAVDTRLYITDNFDAVKLPSAYKRILSTKVAASIESRVVLAPHVDEQLKVLSGNGNPISIRQISGLLYRNDTGQSSVVKKLKTSKTTERANIGHPMVSTLPSDSVIPVHVPSDPTKHIGYFVLLDDFGNPLSNARDSSYYKELNAYQQGLRSKEASSAMLARLKENVRGMGCRDATSIQEMSELYSRAVEHDLLERLRNGIYGENVELSNTQDVYRIMMARSLANKNTQILYVPAELMVYWAFDYNRQGVGRSVLDKSKMLASIRAILLFANTMAAMKNSVNRREAVIELDPDDPEPDRTVEQILTQLAVVQGQSFPISTTRPMDIIDGIRSSAMGVSVTGHPDYPEVKVSVEDRQSSRVLVDNDLDDSMRERWLLSLGVTPEQVDSSKGIEFAAELITRNLLHRKRIAMDQEVTERFIKETVTKYTLNSGTLMTELITAVVEAIKENPGVSEDLKQAQDESVVRTKESEDKLDVNYIIAEFLKVLEIKLPAPDTTKLDTQMEAFGKYSQALDQVLPAYITEDSLEALMGDKATDYMRPVLAMVKGYFLRDWLNRNNVMPELTRILSATALEEEEFSLLEEQTKHVTALSSVLADMVKRIAEKNKSEEGVGTDDGGYDGYGDDTTDSEQEEGDPFAEDTPEEEPVEETEPEETEEVEDAEETEEVEETPEETKPDAPEDEVLE